MSNVLTLCAAQDNGVLLMQCDGYEKSNDQEEQTANSKKVLVRLQKLELSTGKVINLLEKPREEIKDFRLVWNGRIYYNGMTYSDAGYYLYCYDLATGKDMLVPDMHPFTWLGGPYVNVSYAGGSALMNLETGKTLPQEGEALFLMARSSLGFVVSRSIGSEENPGESVAREYCYIPLSAMEDGIQLTDLSVLWTEKMGAY